MTQPTRKRREFRVCPVCQVEFWPQKKWQGACTKTCARLAKRIVVVGPDALSQEMKRRIAEKDPA